MNISWITGKEPDFFGEEEEREMDGEDQDGMLVEMLDDKRMDEETLNEDAVLEKVQ